MRYDIKTEPNTKGVSTIYVIFYVVVYTEKECDRSDLNMVFGRAVFPCIDVLICLCLATIGR